jgi:hypothetical protein
MPFSGLDNNSSCVGTSLTKKGASLIAGRTHVCSPVTRSMNSDAGMTFGARLNYDYLQLTVKG